MMLPCSAASASSWQGVRMFFYKMVSMLVYDCEKSAWEEAEMQDSGTPGILAYLSLHGRL